MSQSPILKALSSMRKNGVKALLMGGQACVFYGAAEFSRDVDLFILPDPENMDRIRDGLRELEAEPVAMPPLDEKFLRAGHAVHFRCTRTDVTGLRIDLMARLRNPVAFEELYERRTTIQIADEIVDLMGLEDLVNAKKTQRDRDWPIIRRLVEQNYLENSASPTEENIRFWMRELRTPELIIEVCSRFPGQAREKAQVRHAVEAATQRDRSRVTRMLADEETRERERDADYWRPLRGELEQLRKERSR